MDKIIESSVSAFKHCKLLCLVAIIGLSLSASIKASDCNNILQYQQDTLDLLRSDDRDPVNHIGRIYQEHYQKSPENYIWLGLVSFASKAISDVIIKLSLFEGMGGSFLFFDHRQAGLLRRNFEIITRKLFLGEFWHHLAYEKGGIEDIRQAHGCGKLPDRILSAWEKIDQGKNFLNEGKNQTDGSVLILEGNFLILEDDQERIVSPSLSVTSKQSLSFLSQIGNVPGLENVIFESPLGKYGESFIEFCNRVEISGPNFSDPKQRMRYYKESVIPTFLKLKKIGKFPKELPY